MTCSPLPIAIIGAGFSGTLAALHLLDRLPARTLLLCERSAAFARGAASTQELVHLLNVRAANMSAWPDAPEHFTDWLARTRAGSPDPDLPRQIHDTAAGTFVARGLYGRYLTELLRAALAEHRGALRLCLVPDEV